MHYVCMCASIYLPTYLRNASTLGYGVMLMQRRWPASAPYVNLQMLFGASLNMTPMAILTGLVMWGSVWGIPGAILSVPLLSIQKVALCTSPTASSSASYL